MRAPSNSLRTCRSEATQPAPASMSSTCQSTPPTWTTSSSPSLVLTDTLNEEDRDGLGEWDGVMVRLDRGHGGVVVVIVSRRPVACSCVGERDGCGRRGAGFGRAGAGIGGCGSAGRAAGEEPAPAQDVDQRPAAQARKGPGGVDHPQLVVDVLAVAFGQDPEIVDPREPSARAGWAWGGQVQYEPAGRHTQRDDRFGQWACGPDRWGLRRVQAPPV